MKAALRRQYGPPSCIQIEECPMPEAADNEILVKVYAASVNRSDCHLLDGKPWIMRLVGGLFRPARAIMGSEFAGEIIACGNKVTRFQPGQKVFGFDDTGVSAHAEYLAITQDKAIAQMPKNLDWLHAATSLEGPHYAFNFINKVKIEPGMQILVNGASGGIGSALVQMLKHLQCQVCAVTESKHLKKVAELGADQLVDFSKENFTMLDQQFDYVFDAVGKSSFGKCKKLLKPGGIYISSELGDWSQNLFLALFGLIWPGKKVRFPLPLNTQASVDQIAALIEQGAYQSLLDRSYPLEQVAEAFSYVAKGLKCGNVAIEIVAEKT